MLNNFTKEEDQYLIDNYGKKKIKDFSKHLGRTEGSIKQRLVRIRKKTKLSLLPKESEYKRLIKGRIKECVVCGKEFKRPKRHYSDKAWYNRKCCSIKCGGKIRQKRIITKCLICKKPFETSSIRKNKYCSYKCYHTTLHGKEPWNKGLTKEMDKRIKSPKTAFKKGSIPHNKGKNWVEWLGKEGAKKMREIRENHEYKDCLICKKKFKVHNYRKNSAKFCSQSCVAVYKLITQAYGQSNTDIERKILIGLEREGYKLGKDFVKQFVIKKADGRRYICDFCFPKKKIIIECDGDYFHVNLNKFKGKLTERQKELLGKHNEKNKFLKNYENGSWTILRFWGSDIKSDLDKCLSIIKKNLNTSIY